MGETDRTAMGETDRTAMSVLRRGGYYPSSSAPNVDGATTNTNRATTNTNIATSASSGGSATGNMVDIKPDNNTRLDAYNKMDDEMRMPRRGVSPISSLAPNVDESTINANRIADDVAEVKTDTKLDAYNKQLDEYNEQGTNFYADKYREYQDKANSVDVLDGEALRREKRRLKQNRFWGAITDAATAVSGLWGANRGVQIPGTNLADVYEARYDKILAENDANRGRRDAYQQFADSLREKQMAFNISNLKEKINNWKEEKRQERADAKEERDAKKAELKSMKDTLYLMLLQKQITEQEYQNEIKRIEALYASQEAKADLALKGARAAAAGRSNIGSTKTVTTEIINDENGYKIGENRTETKTPGVRGKSSGKSKSQKKGAIAGNY